MARTIYKYQLKIEEEQMLALPHHAEILSVQVQGTNVYLWALVDPEQPIAKRVIWCYGTGMPFPEERYAPPKKHLATVQQGVLVWHFFVPDDTREAQG